eukprot:TRINITY_DN6166_c0_g1_i1.p1 TRINITY_DN6166_c0_g1~~TRINITY_DN6166_c0_g1_i1.p1  ORF type:complete len:124 (-),score=19.80 TRINITY_DN6166_c0_g1_i1:77-448(-)
MFSICIQYTTLYIFFFQSSDDNQDLHTAYRRQRQMCIRDRYQRRVHGLSTKSNKLTKDQIPPNLYNQIRVQIPSFISTELNSYLQDRTCVDIDKVDLKQIQEINHEVYQNCLLYTSPSPRDQA